MYAGLVMGALSLYLGYGLILGRFGMPRLHVIGAALSINLSFFAYTLILAFLIFTKRTVLTVPKGGWRPDNALGLSLMKIGIPSALEWILIQVGILAYVAIIKNYGPDALAGYFTGFAVLSLAQTASFGFQAAATTLVGQSVGAREFDRAENAFRRTGILGFVFMGGFGALTALLATPASLGLIFNNLSPASIDYSRSYVLLLVYLMPLMGFFFSVSGGLRGAGDTVWPLISSTAGVYGGRILFGMLLYHLFHPPVAIIWCSMFPDLIIRSVIVIIRLRSGKWKVGKI
jgi:Na+-driven multidrug efflux pump